MMNLQQVAEELSRRLTSVFLPDENRNRPCHGGLPIYTKGNWRDLVLFYEYFHGETGRGCGASHQTGWTALAVKLLENTIDDPDRTATHEYIATAKPNPSYKDALSDATGAKPVPRAAGTTAAF
jgi:hypothetical protein